MISFTNFLCLQLRQGLVVRRLTLSLVFFRGNKKKDGDEKQHCKQKSLRFKVGVNIKPLEGLIFLQSSIFDVREQFFSCHGKLPCPACRSRKMMPRCHRHLIKDHRRGALFFPVVERLVAGDCCASPRLLEAVIRLSYGT